MRCQQLVYPNPKKKIKQGQCRAKAKWKIRLKGITTFEIFVCDEHFELFTKAVNGSAKEWSATPYGEEANPCIQQPSQSATS